MKVHHLNCGTFRPTGGRLVDGQGGPIHRARLVCHCLLVETADGLVLVDTGLGLQAVERPGPWMGPSRRLLSAAPTRAESAARQVTELGYALGDVRDIVLTHLDFDHAGGLADFPHATVHVFEREHRALTAPANAAERLRYRKVQFEHGPKWKTYTEPGEDWFGFTAVRELAGLPPEILMVPLAGHTLGHTGVAVDTGDGWLLHAGDAYFFHGQLNPGQPHCPPVLTAFQNLTQTDRRARLENLGRLRELAAGHHNEVTVFSAHDPVELRQAQRH
ncbi:MBL fold metallo-hydrolase [Amycolatopsis sp. 195334CR]|uniref:MBL fold metallo-hydrolase n=1 Tax=Amycolatopsis sp. 195334CR TaxID=2814588 RepID=UPI001A8CD11B|nr:MBL fold metallo-hydrolase [Amycolatopsis sp. 195334CR]MBN6034839.1 MBL fold metallo-hydrolase [Amycolatopsis sp. 195334CR]